MIFGTSVISRISELDSKYSKDAEVGGCDAFKFDHCGRLCSNMSEIFEKYPHGHVVMLSSLRIQRYRYRVLHIAREKHLSRTCIRGLHDDVLDDLKARGLVSQVSR